MGIIKRGVRNVFRNSIRAFSIILILGLSIGLALTMLIAREAVQTKISSVKSNIGNTISISPAGMRGFEGGGNPLAEEQLKTVATLDHVVTVNKTLSDRLTTDNSSLESSVEAGSLGNRFNNSGSGEPAPPVTSSDSPDSSIDTARPQGDFTPPITVIGTTVPSDLSSSMGGGTFSLTDGKVFEGTSTEKVAIIGTNLAEKNSLGVGSTFSTYDTTFTVIGIFDSGNDFSNNQVLIPLATLQNITSQEGELNSATVTVDSIENIDSVAAAIQEQLGDSADVTNGAERSKQAIEPLENIINISSLSLIGSVVAGSVIILLTMTMIVRERRREIGVYKAIGATNTKVIAQFIVESLTFTIIGAIIGLAIGILTSGWVTNLLVKNSATTTVTAGGGPGGMGRGMGPRMEQVMEFGGASLSNIQTTIGWDIILYGLAGAIAIAIIGSAIPAWLISKVKPAEVMRAE